MATSTPEVISLDDLKDFCNRARMAGGGNVLDALLPAAPTDSSQCLIAKNMNCGCEVSTGAIGPRIRTEDGYLSTPEAWVMIVSDDDTREAIANELGLPVYAENIVLPENVGQLAEDFDTLLEILQAQYYMDEEDDEQEWRIPTGEDAETLQRLAYLYPYIEESIRQAFEDAPFVVDGKIVL